MPFYDHTTSRPYDYAYSTNGLDKKLQMFVDMAFEHPVGSAQHVSIISTATGIYERWRHFATENGALQPEDDARCRAILKLR